MDKCPYCAAPGGVTTQFDCGTEMIEVEYVRSHKCKNRQIAALTERLADLSDKFDILSTAYKEEYRMHERTKERLEALERQLDERTERYRRQMPEVLG